MQYGRDTHGNDRARSDRADAGGAGRDRGVHDRRSGAERGAGAHPGHRASATPTWASRAASSAPSGFPFLLGHEGAGIVEAVGPGVTDAAGRRPRHPGLARAVWRLPLLPGRPAAPLRRQPQRREAHAHAWTAITLTPILGIGTFCTHTLVHAEQAIPIDPALPPAQMSLIGCGVMTGVGAALYSAEVQAGHQRGGLRLRRRRRQRHPGRAAGRRDDDHRRRHRPAQAGVGQGVRRDPHRQPARGRSGRGDQGAHRRQRRQLLVRGGRQRRRRWSRRSGAATWPAPAS